LSSLKGRAQNLKTNRFSNSEYMKQKISNNRISIRIVQTLFLLKASIWVLFGVLHFAQLETPSFLVIFMFSNGIIFLWLSLVIGEKRKWIYYFATFFVAINIVLAVTDEFGISDLVVLAIDCGILIMLVLNRRRLLPNPEF